MAKGLHIQELQEGTVYNDLLSGQPVLVVKVTRRVEWASARGKTRNPVTGAEEVIDIENGQLTKEFVKG